MPSGWCVLSLQGQVQAQAVNGLQLRSSVLPMASTAVQLANLERRSDMERARSPPGLPASGSGTAAEPQTCRT